MGPPIVDGEMEIEDVRRPISRDAMDIESPRKLNRINNNYGKHKATTLGNIRLLFWNAQSLKGDFEKITNVLDLDCDIILIQESWLETHQDIILVRNKWSTNYHERRMGRISKKKKTGGGTIVLFKDGIEILKEVRINKDSGLYQVVINTSRDEVFLACKYLCEQRYFQEVTGIVQKYRKDYPVRVLV